MTKFMDISADILRKIEDFGRVLCRPHANDSERVYAFGRDRELEALDRRLNLTENRSFLLVGPSGCGKTAIVQELARRRLHHQNSYLFLETSTSMLLAGTRYSGELETRVKELLDLARRPRPLVVFFTDIFNLMKAGRTIQSDESIGSFLAPYIESGDLLVAGESTPEWFRSGIERDPTFKKLFYVVTVKELTAREALPVLQGVTDQILERLAREDGLHLHMPESVQQTILELSDSYLTGMAYPGKGVRLLEEVIALKRESELGDLDLPNAAPTGTQLVITQRDVIAALQRFTGIPAALLDDSFTLKLEEVRQFFEARVLGQSEAVNAMVDLVTLIKAGVTDTSKPMGVYLFVGPTGVGKTEMARALAEYIFNSPDRLFRFDMSEYKDYASFEKLIGNPRAWDHSPLQMGSLTTRVRQQPFAVILLDEIEKAHPNIFDIFLQVFDAGRLTDATGQTTNFSQTVIIMTSNIGSDLTQRGLGFHPTDAGANAELVGEALRRHFRPEFLNRLDRQVFFLPLGKEHMRAIAQRELAKVLARSGIARRNMRVDIDEGVLEVLVREGFSPTYGARPLKRAVETMALLPLARQMVKKSELAQGALLRLLPAGNSIIAKWVQDSNSDSDTGSISKADDEPAARAKVRFLLREVSESAKQLQERVALLEGKCIADGMRERRLQLLEHVNMENFWDDKNRARAVIAELNHIDKLLDAVQRLRRRVTELEHFLDPVSTRPSPDQLATFSERLREIHLNVDVVSYALENQGERERGDAFVQLSLIDRAPAPDDIVGLLADMYRNWAKGKGFNTKVIHEDLLEGRKTRFLTLLIEGVSVYGILAAEDGIHEMIYGRTSKMEKHSHFVKVRVLPRLDNNERASDLQLQTKNVRGKGLRVPSYKAHITLLHRDTQVSVESKSDIDPSEARDILADMLRAESDRRADPARNDTSEIADVVRKYTLQPRKVVKDPRTGAQTSNLSELWQGGLDIFLKSTTGVQPDDTSESALADED